jgi:ribonuclease Z
MVEKINLTFLGTGSSIPTARRNHPATLLKYKAENILVDCGEGTQRQFRKAHLNPCKVTKILISHWHGDHVLGLPGLLQTLNLNGYQGELQIYGPKGSKKAFQEMVAPYLGFYWNINKKNGGNFNIVLKEIDSGVFIDSDEFQIEAAEVEHNCPALAYSFIVKEKKRLDRAKLKKMKIPNSPLVGELVKGKTVEINGKKIDGKKLMYVEPARKVAFLMDTCKCAGALKIAKDANVLISEATYSKEEQDIAKEHGHLTSIDAATIAKKAKAKALVLIHLSQRYEGIPKMILGEAKKIFKDTIIPEDLEEIQL